MAALFASTLFLSAVLLFWVQPVIAKMLLPLLGGAPSVWNTCLVFFQAMLLGGYAYAHLISTRLSLARQIATHFSLLTLTALALPFGVPERLVQSLSPDANPVFWLLRALFWVVGLPFFVVASTAPLLQKWFSRTGHAFSGDPYFLYSASNLGSLLALLSYPVLIEPRLRLRHQSWLWSGGYLALVLSIIACGVAVWIRETGRAAAAGRDAVPEGGEPAAAADQEVEGQQRLHWLALAFVPSSLMLGVTSYLATDIASIPLLWIIPLSIYLLTFILAFGRRQMLPVVWLQWLLPVAALGVAFQIVTRGTHPIWLVIVIHLLFLFLGAMVCHGRLARERPAPGRLTEFYLWISLGGVLGGAFNAIVAPSLFHTVIEYPLAIVLVCLLRPQRVSQRRRPGAPRDEWPAVAFLRPSATLLPTGSGPEAGSFREPFKVWSAVYVLDVVLPILVGVFTVALALWIPSTGLKSVNLRNALVVGLPSVACFMLVDRPMRFGLGLTAILAGGWFYLGPHGRTVHVERNFFGVSRVTLGQGGAVRYFVHGNTLHGAQFIDAGRQCEPLAYYSRSGPLAEIFNCYQSKPASRRVAVVGLGAGATACYAEPAEDWTFYEIDPAVVSMARNTNYFSYLSHCAKSTVRIVVGDARLRLRAAPPGYYGLIVLDAFSSDAIPVHLLTREALSVYVSKLAEGGLLAFHISNRYLDLEPVLADLAQDAGVASRHWEDWNVSAEEAENGKEASHWVVMARKEGDLGLMLKTAHWLSLEGHSPPEIWSDDFSNLLGVFKWE